MTSFKKFGEAPPANLQIDVATDNDKRQWQVPEETPVAFIYNRRNYAVMLATPLDLEDFAVGFSLTERVIDNHQEISSIDIHQSSRGIELHISIDDDRLERLDIRQQRRNLVGRAGCGLCGLENAEVFFETLPQVVEQKETISVSAMKRAIAEFDKHQPLNKLTHSVHGAAWADMTGNLKLAREDVGRHNALDKLLGAMARDSLTFIGGFMLISSRCSYELIEKSARLGVRAVLSVSGPTAFAIRKAREANIALYCQDGAGIVEI